MRLAETDEWMTGGTNIHTRVNPYCWNVTCWCHINADYHEAVIHPRPTEEEVRQVYGFLGLLFPAVTPREASQNSVR